MRAIALAGPAGIGLSALALGLSAPSPAEAFGVLASLERAPDLAAPLVAAASLLAWALLAHLVVVGALTLAAALPGRAGATGDAVLRRCAPVGLRRVVALSLGAGLLVGAGGGVAQAGAPGPARHASGPVSLDWPGAMTTDAPSLDWPAPAGTPETGPLRTVAVPPGATPGVPAPVLAPPVGAAPAGLMTPGSGDAVTVQPGDSLWRIAQAALPATATEREVAQAWPSWWSANRQVIGDDPDLVHPGQTLRAPR